MFTDIGSDSVLALLIAGSILAFFHGAPSPLGDLLQIAYIFLFFFIIAPLAMLERLDHHSLAPCTLQGHILTAPYLEPLQ